MRLKRLHSLLLSMLMIILLVGCGLDRSPGDQMTPEPNPSDEQLPNQNNEEITDNEPINDVITEQIKNMSLEEKLGQLIFAGISGTSLTEEAKQLIHQYKIGGIILYKSNMENPDQALELINSIKSENKNNHIPIFLGIDQEGGIVSRLPGLTKLPTNKKIGELNDPDFSYTIGQLLGQQLNAFGLNVNFAPVLDVNSNPNNPVIGDRSFGNNPEIVTSLGIETMKGMQAQNVIPVIKHFPGHGDTSVDSHLELPIVHKTIEQLNQIELPPFRAAIEQGTDMVMVAHILLPEIDETKPATMSQAIITSLLRGDFGYDGVVITDDMTMQAITDNYEIGSAAVQSIIAGGDIIMVAHEYANIVASFHALQDAVNNDVISEQRIDESVRRILALKMKYGLTDELVSDLDLESLNRTIADVIAKTK